MEKTKTHKIEVRQKPDSGTVMTGANTELLLDGKPIKMVQGFKFEVQAGGVAKVTLEMIAEVGLAAELGELTQVYVNKEDLDGKN